MEQASHRGFGTEQSEAIFWSGLGRGRSGVLRGQKFAAENGGKTLEMTAGGKYLDDLDLFGPNSPLTQSQAMQVWEHASRGGTRGTPNLLVASHLDFCRIVGSWQNLELSRAISKGGMSWQDRHAGSISIPNRCR